MRKVSHFTLFFLIPLISFSQPAERKMSASQYIDNFKDEAIREMLAHGVPASITLAQGMLESGNGNSDLAVYANNHFGIKCHKGWDGPTFIKDDDAKDECFRKYSNVLDSYSDHSMFLKTRARYASLFELKSTDYKGWAKGLKEAGYATDPKYTQRLLEIIETHKLHEFDKVEGLPNITVQAVTPKHPETIQPREVLRFRMIKYIIVKPGDSFYKIAHDTDKDLWQLYKFNDIKPEEKLIAGQKLYLQPKRNKAKEPVHTVKSGETMRSISQLHGIKLKSLYKKNNMKPGEEPVIGQQLQMRSRKKTS
ncbi:MAG: glucosaminidase domain-containing protein [Bacteroidota bacterium]|nr:glucosaminidase domain-containing protein [Bacteroidota bacterium]